MRTLIEVVAGVAILADAVVHGTDVFGTIVLRPAITSVDRPRLPCLSPISQPATSSAALRREQLVRRACFAAVAGAADALAGSPIRGPLQARRAVAPVAEQPPASAPAPLMLRMKTRRRGRAAAGRRQGGSLSS